MRESGAGKQKIDELQRLQQLNGGQKFTKIHLSHAYLQLEIDETTRKLLTINTHKGLHELNRKQYGAHAASGIFMTS